MLDAAAPADAVLVIDEAYVEYAMHSPGFPDSLAELAAREMFATQLGGLCVLRLRIAPRPPTFLFIDLGRPNTPCTRHCWRGVITKAWKERGFENFIRVSVGTGEENQRFVDALADILA